MLSNLQLTKGWCGLTWTAFNYTHVKSRELRTDFANSHDTQKPVQVEGSELELKFYEHQKQALFRELPLD